MGAFLLGVCGLRAGPALDSVESISNPQSVSKGDRPDRVPHPWPASPGCMCRAPARPTPRSRDGGKTPSSRPLDGVHNFPPELNRPGEPGLTFQASEDTAQPPRYSPQRDQPHGSGSPDLCRPGLHPHHTPHARPPHHSSVRPAGCHALVEPLLHLGRVGQCGWGCGSERLSAPSPSSHPLPEAFPGPCDLAAAAAAPCLGGWADVCLQWVLQLAHPTSVRRRALCWLRPRPAERGLPSQESEVWVSAHVHGAE